MTTSKSHATLVAALLMLVIQGIPAVAGASAVQWLESPLAGPDRDGDGIRDDVGKMLDLQYSHASQLHWAREVARASQRFITSDDNPFAIYRAQSEMRRAVMCLEKISDQPRTAQLRDTVLGWVLNNPMRKQAYENGVARWESEVRLRDLPSRPDDRWVEGCGKFDKPVPVSEASAVAAPAPNVPSPLTPPDPVLDQQPGEAPAPASLQPPPATTDPVDSLPPPNFFLKDKAAGEGSAPAEPAELSPPPPPPLPEIGASDTDLPASVTVPAKELDNFQQIPEWAQVPAPGKAQDIPAAEQPVPVPPPMEDSMPAPKAMGLSDYVRETDGQTVPAPESIAIPVESVPELPLLPEDETAAVEPVMPEAQPQSLQPVEPAIPLLEVPDPVIKAPAVPATVPEEGSAPAIQEPVVPALTVPEEASAPEEPAEVAKPQAPVLPTIRQPALPPATAVKPASDPADEPGDAELEARRKALGRIGLTPSKLPEKIQAPAPAAEPVKPAPVRIQRETPAVVPAQSAPASGVTPTSSIEDAPTADGYQPEAEEDEAAPVPAAPMDSGAELPAEFESLGPFIKEMKYEKK